MSSASLGGYIAIDTNILEHLLNPCQNTASHISQLLRFLQEQRTALVIDDKGRITSEYNHRLGSRIANADDTHNEIYILRYWIQYADRRQIGVNFDDALMAAIRQVIIEHAEAVDRIFVYVVFSIGETLISNDRRNIVDGPSGESVPRRYRLFNATKKVCPRGAGILTSEEAHSKII